ncbi:FIG00636713: repeated hypothetical protein [hydrothermal vent metagenome]|uniref:Uncharacterized protein n=1 Tax=hydrothermal vent metagenome TaxID=652676 RepID=A0A3B1B3L5_9ZZZZ
MHVFEMVVLIVAIVVIGGLIKSYFERNKVGGSSDAFDDLMHEFGLSDYYSKKEVDVYIKKIEAMEQRIQVLERIATDKGRDLADEIDNLKHRR